MDFREVLKHREKEKKKIEEEEMELPHLKHVCNDQRVIVDKLRS